LSQPRKAVAIQFGCLIRKARHRPPPLKTLKYLASFRQSDRDSHPVNLPVTLPLIEDLQTPGNGPGRKSYTQK
jgi:hypothetical protein